MKILKTDLGLEYRRITPGEYLVNPGWKEKGYRWILLKGGTYYSPRYDKTVTVEAGMLSDGATGAFDIRGSGWWFHDQLCNTGRWDDGSKVSNIQASKVLKGVLKDEGFWLRDWWWMTMTFLFGGGEARENGMFTVTA